MNTLSTLQMKIVASGITMPSGSELLDMGKGAFASIAPYLAAIIIFFVGKWLAGKIRNVIIKLLNKTSIDEKLGKAIGQNAGISEIIATIIYCVLLLFVVVIALTQAGLNDAVTPLTGMLSKIFGFLPQLIGTGIIAFIAFFGAKIVRMLLESVMNGARLDERLGSKPGTTPISSAIGVAAYSLVVLLFAPAILANLEMPQISEPIQGIVTEITNAVPYIITAAVILGIGFFIAQIAQKLIKNLLDASGANALPAKIGLDIPQEGSRSISSVVSFLVMITIVVAVAVQAITSLKLEILSDLTSGLMDGYLNLLGAVIIFGFGLIAAKFAYANLADKNITLAKVARIAILILTAVVALRRSGIAPELTGLPYMAAIYALAFAVGVGGAIALGLGGKDFIARYLERKG